MIKNSFRLALIVKGTISSQTDFMYYLLATGQERVGLNQHRAETHRPMTPNENVDYNQQLLKHTYDFVELHCTIFIFDGFKFLEEENVVQYRQEDKAIGFTKCKALRELGDTKFLTIENKSELHRLVDFKYLLASWAKQEIAGQEHFEKALKVAKRIERDFSKWFKENCAQCPEEPAKAQKKESEKLKEKLRSKRGRKISEEDSVDLYLKYIQSLPPGKKPSQPSLAEFTGYSQTHWSRTINKNHKFNTLLRQKNEAMWTMSHELVKQSTYKGEHVANELSKGREIPYNDAQKPPDETSESVEEKIENDMILQSTLKEPVINAILEKTNEDNKEAARFELKQKSLAQLKQIYETYVKYT